MFLVSFRYARNAQEEMQELKRYRKECKNFNKSYDV